MNKGEKNRKGIASIPSKTDDMQGRRRDLPTTEVLTPLEGKNKGQKEKTKSVKGGLQKKRENNRMGRLPGRWPAS